MIAKTEPEIGLRHIADEMDDVRWKHANRIGSKAPAGRAA
jgi:hypothetical protein